jgi:hypothetical protein
MSGIGQTGKVGDGQSSLFVLSLLDKLTIRRGQRGRCGHGSRGSCAGTSGRPWEELRSKCCIYPGPQFRLRGRVSWAEIQVDKQDVYVNEDMSL